MPLDKLVERILHDAREQADAIRDESLKTKGEILAEAESKDEELYRRLTTTAQREADEEKRQKVAMAGLDARKEVLEEKQALIKGVFDGATRALSGLPVDEYVGFMVGPLSEAVGDDDGELILSPRDHDAAGPELVRRANKELEKAGRRGRVSLAEETRHVTGGFILRMGGIEVNNSLEALMSQRRDEFEPRVVEILFGEGANPDAAPGGRD